MQITYRARRREGAKARTIQFASSRHRVLATYCGIVKILPQRILVKNGSGL